jgi:hypothetical protein
MNDFFKHTLLEASSGTDWGEVAWPQCFSLKYKDNFNASYITQKTQNSLSIAFYVLHLYFLHTTIKWDCKCQLQFIFPTEGTEMTCH